MMKSRPRISVEVGKIIALLALMFGTTGCTAFLTPRDPFPVTAPEPPMESPVPRELDKVTLPIYVIEPPDILLRDRTARHSPD